MFAMNKRESECPAPSPDSKRSRICSSSTPSTSADDFSLPEEIQLLIFEYLPLQDRKNLRLVNKYWNELVTPKTKFVFQGASCIPDIVKILESSNVSRMYIEFQCLPIYHLPADVWEKAGRRIYDLSFNNCELKDEIFKNVFLHCVNLQSLDIPRTIKYSLDTRHSFELMLDYFIQNNIKHTQLHRLSVEFEEFFSFNSRQIRKIFDIFPYIKHLGCSYPSVEDATNECIEPATQLESLILHSAPFFWLKKPIIPIFHLRLTNFEINWEDIGAIDIDSSVSMKRTLLRFFIDQENLRRVSLSIMSDPDFEKELLFHVLKHCHKLREFCLEFPGVHPIHLSHEDLLRFVRSISNLRHLTLEGSFSTESPLPQSSKIVAKALNTLNLKTHSSNREFDVFILKHCPKLKHLKLEFSNGDVLREVFAIMPNLSTLILRRIEDVSSLSLTGSFTEQLEQLQNYEITYPHKLHFEILDTLVFNFRFPHLKCFKLQTSPNVNFSKSELIEVASRMPELEILRISPCITLKQIINLCKILKNLYYLTSWRSTIPCKLERILTACPNLKFLEVSGATPKMKIFNRSTQSIESISPFYQKESVFG